MSWPTADARAVQPLERRLESVGIATIGRTERPVTISNALIVYASVGSAIASPSSDSSSRTGNARASRRKRAETRSSRIGNSG